MKSFIDKTVGGLSPAYYIRHFLFGLIIPAVLIYAHRHAGGKGVDPKEYGFFVNTLLYPYARFLYERITSYIVGNNIFIQKGRFNGDLLVPGYSDGTGWNALPVVSAYPVGT